MQILSENFCPRKPIKFTVNIGKIGDVCARNLSRELRVTLFQVSFQVTLVKCLMCKYNNIAGGAKSKMHDY